MGKSTDYQKLNVLSMTSPLARIKSNPQESKRLIGIKYEDFIKLVSLAEQRHLEKQA